MKVLVKEVWAGEAMDFDMAGQMKRHDLTNLSDTAVEDWGQRKTTEYMGILGSDRFYYSFQFLNDFPKKFRFDGRGMERYEVSDPKLTLLYEDAPLIQTVL